MRGTLSVSLFFYLLLPTLAVRARKLNLTQCLENIRNETWRKEHLNDTTQGATDNRGHPVPFSENTTAITYDLCKRACGTGHTPIDQARFPGQFTSWLLPWIALLSQLPFGANNKFDNLASVVLAAGSPTLAAYSLALTVLNGRWVTKHFASCSYPSAENASRVLNSLQQCPLSVTSDHSLLSSLVILPENDHWWSELIAWLNYTHTWSIAAATSIAWVIISFILTLFDPSGPKLMCTLDANGPVIGAPWLWLLPIVVGWLQISPNCDSDGLKQAINHANRIAHVATPSGESVPVKSRSKRFAISFACDPRGLSHPDEGCTIPIYNYARFLSWVQAVETVAAAFHAASERADRRIPVDDRVEWETTSTTPSASPVFPRHRRGTRTQVDEYCIPLEASGPDARRITRDPKAWLNMAIASVIALLLQWGTGGAAISIFWFTPTIGLGCRSGAYLLYSSIATLIWAVLVSSSILSHYATAAITPPSRPLAKLTSVVLHRFGKALSAFNALALIGICIFELTGFFDNCYCDGNVLGGKKGGFAVLRFEQEDRDDVRVARMGGLTAAATTIVLFLSFVAIFRSPRLRPETDD